LRQSRDSDPSISFAHATFAQVLIPEPSRQSLRRRRNQGREFKADAVDHAAADFRKLLDGDRLSQRVDVIGP
jgi:hypothetical protein